MQRLLTGYARFSEFVGEPWRKTRIANLANLTNGRAFKPSDSGY